jgi:hypothetical protein
VFRRRRREGAAQPGFDDDAARDDLDIQGSPDFPDDLADTDGEPDDDDPNGGSRDSGGRSGGRTGPWDASERFPELERMDFGSLQIPVREGLEVQINMAEDQGVWIAVLRGDNGLQLQAFAAPKTSGLWDEVRQEIADEVAKSGGDCEEAEGPFGAELHARVQTGEPGHGRTQKQPVRFLGVDGPRWFLRGVISGPAARRPELARQFEEVFADVVVVRGDHPAPPRDLLEIRLPDEARAALDEQMAAEADGQEPPNPFERGPEITETR